MAGWCEDISTSFAERGATFSKGGGQICKDNAWTIFTCSCGSISYSCVDDGTLKRDLTCGDGCGFLGAGCCRNTHCTATGACPEDTKCMTDQYGTIKCKWPSDCSTNACYTMSAHVCTYQCESDQFCDDQGHCYHCTPSLVQNLFCEGCGYKTQSCSADGQTLTVSSCFRNESLRFCGGAGICESNAQCNSSMNVYWADTTENRIIKAEKNDKVLLFATASTTTNGLRVNFKVNSSCSLIDLGYAPIINGKANVTWTANNCSKGDWTFNATFENMSLMSKISDALFVNKTPDNAPLNIGITTPQEGELLNASLPGLTHTPVWFNQSSYDLDDFISWTWDFGDGNSDLNHYNASHDYLLGGPMTVRLTVESGTGSRYQTLTKQIKVLINNMSDNRPLAIISQPIEGNTYPMDTDILLNASLSKDAESPMEKLNFTWEIEGEDRVTRTGIPVLDYNFMSENGRAGYRTITLTVTDESEKNDTDSVTIFLSTSNETCDENGIIVPVGKCGNLYNYGIDKYDMRCNSSSKTMYHDCVECDCLNQWCDITTGNCIDVNCDSGTSDESCSNLPGCAWNETACISCNDPSINRCSFYSSADSCGDDKCNLGFFSGGSCIWKDETICTTETTSTVSGCSGVSCTQTVKCENGNYNVICSSSNNNEDCCDKCIATKLQIQDIACSGDAGTKVIMPFFGWTQFIFSLLILSVYYLVSRKRYLKQP